MMYVIQAEVCDVYAASLLPTKQQNYVGCIYIYEKSFCILDWISNVVSVVFRI